MVKFLLKICFFWGLLVLLLAFLAANTLEERAAAIMLFGLLFFWVLIGGGIMLAGKEKIKSFINELNWGWRKKFVFFATGLALIEELVALTMNNLAPALGVPKGVYLTATNNYLELVTQHSVVVFLPMFIVWAWLLSRYDFKPGEVMILFGLNGVLGESFLSSTALLGAGFWILVYGLMIYLPAFSIPSNRPVRKPKPFHYVTAAILPFAGSLPIAILIGLLT